MTSMISITKMLNDLGGNKAEQTKVKLQIIEQTSDLQTKLKDLGKFATALSNTIKAECELAGIMEAVGEGAKVLKVTNTPLWNNERLLEMCVKYGVPADALFECQEEATSYYKIV